MRVISFIESVVIIMFLSGCANYKIGREMRSFAKSSVELPEDMQSVYRRNAVPADIVEDEPVLVVYHDSLECSSCQINHLQEMLPVYEMSDTLDFQVVTVFSPRQEEYDDVLRQLMVLDFPYPVYIDYTGSFREHNRCIPEDKRFHSFLIDRDRHPVFVGNPVSDNDLWTLFVKTLDRQLKDRSF